MTKLRHGYFPGKFLRFWLYFSEWSLSKFSQHVKPFSKLTWSHKYCLMSLCLWCLYYNVWTRFYLFLCTWRVSSSHPEYYDVWTPFYLFLCTWKVSSSHPKEFYKKVFLKTPQDSQENICAAVSFAIKLQPGGVQLYWIQNLV